MTVDVQNTGDVLSDEVVQLYVQTAPGSVPSPRVRLADFHRVRDVKPLEKVTVYLVITPQYLSVVQNEGKENFWCGSLVSSINLVVQSESYNLSERLATESAVGLRTRCRNPTIAVEAGEVTVSVGGGQPHFTPGVLNSSLAISHPGMLTTHFRCSHGVH